MAITAFIGGGNMASALVGGLRRAGRPAEDILVVDPDAAQRHRLEAEFGVRTLAAADAGLTAAELVVWAVKPQFFGSGSSAVAPLVRGALHLSVMAGIRSGAIAQAVGTGRVVRAMPNTPALIGQGIAGLYARPEVDASGRQAVETVLASTGRLLWVDEEADLDAVTAVSGSGPAYVFYVAEALVEAGRECGLEAGEARELALATLAGAAALAQGSDESLATLRERVTSKGGTTAAALAVLDEAEVAAALRRAVRAARDRARELGDAFG